MDAPYVGLRGLRGERGAFIADENVTRLPPSARAKSLPAPAAPNEGPHFVPRLTSDEQVRHDTAFVGDDHLQHSHAD